MYFFKVIVILLKLNKNKKRKENGYVLSEYYVFNNNLYSLKM